MSTNSTSSKGCPRHFSRGQALLIGLLAALVPVACGGDLSGEASPGTAGSSGTGQGGTGGAVGQGGTGGAAGRGGTGGAAGRGGAGDAAGRGGTWGGSLPDLPACPTGTPTFSVCVVRDSDVLPLPISGVGGMAGMHRDLVKAAVGNVETVGAGTAPARCQDARVFGATASGDWWFQVRTSDNVLWTIGLSGLGDTPLVMTGDKVTLDLDYERTTYYGAVPEGPVKALGWVQVSNGAGTPLVWAGVANYGMTWLSLNRGQGLCNLTTATFGCPATRYEVAATVNGSAATVAPFSAANVGSYYLAVGEYDIGRPATQTSCAFDAPPAFTAAAVKR